MTPTKLRILIAAQLVTLVLGLSAIGWGVYANEKSRINARRDTCHLIVGLARAAAGTNKKAIAAANAYIARTALSDCNYYATHDTGRRPHNVKS